MNNLSVLSLILSGGILTQLFLPNPFDLILIGIAKTGVNILLIFLFATIGLTLGASIDYYFGKSGRYLFKKNKSSRRFKKAENFYKRYGKWSLTMSFIPFIGKYFPIIAGLMDTPFSSFIILFSGGRIIYYSFIFMGLKLLGYI